MVEERKLYNILVGKPERKRPFGKPRHRWGDGFKTYLREIGSGGVQRVYLAQDRDRWRVVVNT
jgi:hypothetical protein